MYQVNSTQKDNEQMPWWPNTYVCGFFLPTLMFKSVDLSHHDVIQPVPIGYAIREYTIGEGQG